MSKTRLVGGVLAAAIAFVGGWEGLRLYSYKDVVGVWTACYGETRGIKPGMKFTKAQCDKQFAARLVEFETGMRRCLKQPDTLPQETYLAFLSLSYNIGTNAFCRSTVVRRANSGNLRGACDAMTMWNRGGGRVIQGLVNRRADERKLCLKGLR
ncbi:lysozyme [Nitratireductor sp. ac15]